MTDFAKLQKLLNLCSSASDAEALAALRTAQKLVAGNLGDFIVSLAQNSNSDSTEDLSQELFEAESEKLRVLEEKYSRIEKDLRKRERDNTRLKRDNKDLAQRLKQSEEAREAAAESAAKRDKPGEYEVLEKLFEAELVKNDRLKSQLADKDKFVKKGMRDVSRLKRGKGSDDNRVEELEKMVNELALEVMDYKDRERERARHSLSAPRS